MHNIALTNGYVKLNNISSFFGGGNFLMTTNHKLLKSAALVGAIATTGAVTTATAHADATPNQPAASSTTQDQLTNLKQQQTQAEADLAKQNATEYAKDQATIQPQIDRSQADLKAQQASQASQDAAKLQSAQAQYQAQADTATKQENQQYNNAVNTENAQYASITAAQQSANQKVLKDASAHIFTPDQQIQQRQDAKASYTNQANQVESQKATNVKQTEADFNKQSSDLQNQINQKQSAVSKVHDTQLKSATDAVNKAQDRVNIDTQAKNQAQNSLVDAKSKLDQAQTALKQAEQNRSPFAYVKKTPALMKYLNDLKNDASLSVIRNDAEKVEGYVDGYLENSEVNKEKMKVTVHNGVIITPEFNKLMSIYYASMSNYFRNLIGLPEVHVNDESVQVAVENALQSVKDGYGTYKKGHDYKAIEDIQYKHNADASTENMNFDGPLIYSGLRDKFLNDNREVQDGTYTISLATAYSVVCDTFYDYFFEMRASDATTDGHTLNILGGDVSDLGNEYVGFSFQLPTACTHADTLFYRQEKPSDQLLNFATIKIDKLQQAVTTEQANYNFAKIQVDQATSQLSTDAQTLKFAKDKLAKVKATKATDSPEVTQLKQQLQQLNTDYQAKLNSIDNKYKGIKQKLLNQYNQKLADIAKEPTSIDELKKNLDQKLTDHKVKHDDKLNQLVKNHEAKLDAIKANVEKQLNDLKQQLVDQHKRENQPLIDKITKLQLELVNKKTQLNRQLTDLKVKHRTEYDTLVAKLTPKQTKSAVVKSNSDHYTTVNGQVVNLKLDNGKSKAATVSALATAVTTYQTQEKYGQLPQTGNSNSRAIIALGVLSSMFGLGLVARKRENK